MQSTPEGTLEAGKDTSTITPHENDGLKKMYPIFGAMLLVLVIMTVVSYRAVSEMTSASGWNTHTYEVLREVKGLSQGLYSMQVAGRSYILTGDDAFRVGWEAGKKDVSNYYQRAEKLTADNRKQQERLVTFKAQFTRWMQLYNPALALRRTPGGGAAAIALANRQEMTRFPIVKDMKSLIKGMEDEEKTLLAQRAQTQASWASVTRNSLLVYGLLAILLTAGLSVSLARSNQMLESTNAGLSKEISERHRAEREIRDLHDYNEQILSSTTEGIIGLNPRGRITFANPAAAKMIAWDAQQVIGKAVDAVLQRDIPDATLSPTRDNLLNASLRDGRVHSVPDGIFTRKDGSRFNVEYTITPLREEGDELKEEVNVTGAVITFRDITVRKRTEMSLLRLASIVESSKDAILGHNLDGRIVSLNSAASKLYGYTSREVEGCSMTVLFPPDRAEEVEYLIEKIKNGERVEPYQTVVQAKGGDHVDVALTLYPVTDGNGNIMGSSSNARRIVKRRSEEQLPVYMTELRLVNDNENGAEAAQTAGASSGSANG